MFMQETRRHALDTAFSVAPGTIQFIESAVFKSVRAPAVLETGEIAADELCDGGTLDVGAGFLENVIWAICRLIFDILVTLPCAPDNAYVDVMAESEAL